MANHHLPSLPLTGLLTAALIGLGAAQTIPPADVSTAQFGASNFDTLTASGTIAPWGLPSVAFDDALNTPNATTSLAFSGPDVSRPYPGGDLIAGWGLTLNVTQDVPLRDSMLRNTPDGVSVTNSFASGAHLKLTVPGLPAVPAAEWDVCVSFFRMPLAMNMVSQGDDGSCSFIGFSPECVSDLETMTAAMGFGDVVAGRRQCRCVNPASIASCAASMPGINQMICTVETFTSNDLRAANGSSLDVFRYAGQLHGSSTIPGPNMANSMPFDFVKKMVWPTVVLWGPGDGSKTQVNNTAKLQCVSTTVPVKPNVGLGAPGTGYVALLLVLFIAEMAWAL